MVGLPSTIGKRGKYRVLTSLGSGGFAEVYLTALRGPVGVSKLVVIKQLKAEFALDSSFLVMFVDEARLAARLNHPNVVQTFEVVEASRDCFIAMEYLEGQPLNRVLAESTHKTMRLDPLWAARVVADALSGVHYAHELTDRDGTPLNVIHRDLSPHNIFVTYEGQVKVMDFGLAKAESNLSVTEVGMIKGKLAYMAPEQLRGGDMDRRADVFAMGIVLWELIAQQRMRSMIDEPRRMAEEHPPSVRVAREDVDVELEAIVAKALEPDPAKRFQTARAMRDALDVYMVGKHRVVRPEDVSDPIRTLFGQKRAELDLLVRDRLALLPDETQDNDGMLARAVAESLKPSPFTSPTTDPPRMKVPTIPPSKVSTVPPPRSNVKTIPPGGAPMPRQSPRDSGQGRMLAVGAGVGAFVFVLPLIGVTVWNALFPANKSVAPSPLPAPVIASSSVVRSSAASEASASSPVDPSRCPLGMAAIAGGTFVMGTKDAAAPEARPAHDVTLGAYCIDTNEVTVVAYEACVVSGRCTPAATVVDGLKTRAVDHELFDTKCNARDPARKTHPLNCVSHAEAEAFCTAYGKRLPTEAEWELAARGIEGRPFPWGDMPPSASRLNACGAECVAWKKKNRVSLLQSFRDDLAFLVGLYPEDDTFLDTAPVGSFVDGSSVNDVYDLAGNVEEWVADAFAAYADSKAPPAPPTLAPAALRAVRGGSWTSARPSAIAGWARRGEPPDRKSATIGFRCAR